MQIRYQHDGTSAQQQLLHDKFRIKVYRADCILRGDPTRLRHVVHSSYILLYIIGYYSLVTTREKHKIDVIKILLAIQ